MSSSPVEGIENVGDDECSSPEEDSTEISRINSHDNINRQIDQSVLLHEIIKCAIKQNYLAPLKKDVKRCLELGYSSGVLMMELASEFTDCEFHGMDIEPSAPNDTYPQNCHFEKGDFYQGIPYPDAHFDYVYLRCTLAIVQADKFDFLLGELTRVLKKGGWIEFTEPSSEIRSKGRFGNTLEEAWRQVKNIDVEIIHKLSDILSGNGFINVKESSYDIPLGEHGGEIGANTLTYWRTWMQAQKDHLATAIGYKNQQEFDEFVENTRKEFNEHRSSFTVHNFIAQKV